jgi:hypothetical protein
MAIVSSIQRHEHAVFGDSCLTLQLSEIVRDAMKQMEYYHEDPLDALKQAESHLTDAINMLDQANDRYKTTTDLGKKADALMAGVQELIRWMERPEPERGDDGHDTIDWEER